MVDKRLALVIDMAHERQQAAAQQLSEVQSVLASAEEQLNQLEAYQAQYLDQSQVDASRGISVQALADARRFIGELDGVIRSQRGTVDQRAQEVARVREMWIDATRQLQAVEKLAALRESERAHKLQKIEQQMADDLYGQQALRRRGEES